MVVLGLPSAGFEGMATTPLRRGGGLEDTSSRSKTTCIIQRDANEWREANVILRSVSLKTAVEVPIIYAFSHKVHKEHRVCS